VVIVAIAINIDKNVGYLDPLCTFIFAVIVSYITIPLTKKSFLILLDAVPV
jgi:Co/Zn/Cd efflux system component